MYDESDIKTLDNRWWKNIKIDRIPAYGIGAAFTQSAILSALQGGSTCLEYQSIDGGLSQNIDVFKEMALSVGCNLLKKDFDSIGRETYYCYGCTDAFIIIGFSQSQEPSIKVNCYTTKTEILEKVKEICLKHIKSPSSNEDGKGLIYTPLMTKEGIDFKKVGKGGRTLVRENYQENILNDYDFIISSFNEKEPSGRLVVLQGPPGTGKSFLIRGMLSEIKNSAFVMISPDQVGALAHPSFFTALIDLKDELEEASEYDKMLGRDYTGKYSMTLVVEDADSILVPRSPGTVNVISTLLNFADGIVGEALDVRIICSTNANIEKFDDAVTRPGRLLRSVYIGPLSIVKASEIYDRLTENIHYETGKYSLGKEYTLAEVYALARGDKPQEEKKKKMGF